MRRKEGITLIALVVTIIIILILAGISLNLVLGDSGIVTKAKEAKYETRKALATERVEIEVAGSYGEEGKIEINTLNSNLKNHIKELTYKGKELAEGNYITEEELEEGIYVNVDGFDILIKGSAGQKVEELVDESTDPELEKFITKWKTTEANESIKIPLDERFEFDFLIDYGDGSKYRITSATDSNATHAYATPGIYTIVISGNCPAISFKAVPDSKDKLVELVQWGATGFENIDFKNATNLAGNIPTPTKNSLNKLMSVGSLFSGCVSLTGEIPENLFYESTELRSVSSTFLGCTNLTGTIPETLFDRNPNIEHFSWTFNQCKGLTGEIPKDLFKNNKEATTFEATFYECENLTGQIPKDLFKNSTKVTSFLSTFYGCKNLTGEIPANLFANNPLVENVKQAFYKCERLNKIYDTMFDNNEKITDFSSTFKYCTALEGNAPDIWNREGITATSCYKGCSNLSNYASIPTLLKE